MTVLHARPHEIRAMLDGDVFCIVRPLKPQPRTDHCYMFSGMAVFHNANLAEPIVTLTPQFTKGNRLIVKEAWQMHPHEGVMFSANNPVNAFGWKPAQNMRQEHSRLTLSVSDVTVKRLHDVTEEEARLAAVKEFHWHFQHADHGNPWVCVARCKVHRCNISQVNSGEAA